jgi:membrane dipeptidase
LPVRDDIAVIIDAHAHTADVLPRIPRAVTRACLRKTIPAATTLTEAFHAGIDALVVEAVGDRSMTVLHGRSGFRAVRSQLRAIRSQAHIAGAIVVGDAAELIRAQSRGTPAVILGVEGIDAIGTHLDRLDELYRLGVRVVVPVHLGNNGLGKTALPWYAYVRIPFVHHKPEAHGLTAFGAEAVARMNDLGIVIDVSHCNRPTILDIVGASRAPVIASHSGARAISDFERYMTDAELLAVARSGGVIGLWPYYFAGHGVPDMATLVRHAVYIKDLVGAEHLCIGTDLNGLNGAMAGGGRADDIIAIGRALAAEGFTASEIRGVTGDNFLRVFRQVTSPGRTIS